MQANSSLKIFSVISILIFSNYSGIAQNESKKLKNARKQLIKNNYDEAKTLYDDLIDMDASNGTYHFEGGLAYFNSGVEVEKSVSYFENALDLIGTDTIAEEILYLAKSYHYVGEYDKAIQHYESFENFIERDKTSGQLIAKDVSRQIQMCKTAKKYRDSKSKEVTVTNMGSGVNTTFHEYAPLVNKQQQTLLFTARRGKEPSDDNDLGFEDIYIALKEGEAWGASMNANDHKSYFSHKINSKYHDATVGFSPDENSLYTYRENTIWISSKKRGKFGRPKKLTKNINNGTHVTSVYVSPDKQTIYFSSNKENGFGGRDLYKAKAAADGSWGVATNLGGYINTAFDEDAPFVTENGNTLFFSSSGHNTMGDFDIFKCTMKDNGEWSAPENLGLPINSPGKDIYYQQDSAGEMAFFSSNRANGYGRMDLYSAELMCRNIPNTEIRGVIYAGANKQPVDAIITVFDSNTDQEVGSFRSNPSTGKFLLILPPENNYKSIIKTGNQTYEKEFSLPRQCEYFQMYQEIAITEIRNTDNQLVGEELAFYFAPFDVKYEVEKYYGLDDLETITSKNAKEYNASNSMNIGSKLLHNNSIPAKEVKTSLVNSKNEIVATTTTGLDGSFLFANMPKDNYSILFDEQDIQNSYFDNNSSYNKSVVVNGDLNLTGVDSENLNVYLVNQDNSIVNSTKASDSGIFALDNVPNINVDNSKTFNHNILTVDPDEAYSAFIKSLDKEKGSVVVQKEYDNRDIDPSTENTTSSSAEEEGPAPFMDKLKRIVFDFNQTIIANDSKVILDKISEYMKQNQEVELTIEGHTDCIGTDNYNLILSEKRANAAFNYLKNKGVEDRRMNMKWFGESKPELPNFSPSGEDLPTNRHKNRRVNFRVVSPSSAQLMLSLH